MALGTAIGLGAAAAIGSVVNAVSQSKTNKSMMEYQTSERQATQAYNNPVEQRKRFEAAGINPYFALGNIDAGNIQQQSSPALQSPQTGDVLKNLASGISEGYNVYQEKQATEQYQLGIEQLKVDTRYKLTEKLLQLNQQRLNIEGMHIDNKTKQKQLSFLDKQIESLQLDIDATKADFNEQRASVVAQRKVAELDVRAHELSNDYQEFFNELQKKLGPEQVNLLKSQIANQYSQVNLNSKSASNVIADTAVKNAQEKGVRIDNFQKNKLNYLIREGVRLDNKVKRWNSNHPSYFDKFLGSYQSFSRATGLPDERPRVRRMSNSWTDSQGTTRW